LAKNRDAFHPPLAQRIVLDGPADGRLTKSGDGVCETIHHPDGSARATKAAAAKRQPSPKSSFVIALRQYTFGLAFQLANVVEPPRPGRKGLSGWEGRAASDLMFFNYTSDRAVPEPLRKDSGMKPIVLGSWAYV